MEIPKTKITANGIEVVSPMDENDYRKKIIAELHDIALSLRVMSERNVVLPEKKTYKDMYFAPSKTDE